MSSEEKKNLLVNEEKKDLSYGTENTQQQPEAYIRETHVIEGSFLYRHRTKIPGYGVYRMLRSVHPYAHWVLFMMLMVYLINQLDRYTLPTVVKEIGYDLEYGDKQCMPNRNISSEILDAAGNLTAMCSVDTKNISIQ